MALTELDRRLIDRCLNHEAQAWREFVDRFLGVIYHVVHHTAGLRDLSLGPAEAEELAAEVMTQIVQDDFRVLRNFRGRSSLATYLAVIARRVVVRQLVAGGPRLQSLSGSGIEPAAGLSSPEIQIDNEDEVHRLLEQLNGREAELVRSYYLDHKSYKQISQEMGIPENTIGPLLSRLRGRLRKAAPRT